MVDLKARLADTDAAGENVNELRESNTPNKRAPLKNATLVIKRARAVEQVALFVDLAFQTKIDKSLSDGA